MKKTTDFLKSVAFKLVGPPGLEPGPKGLGFKSGVLFNSQELIWRNFSFGLTNHLVGGSGFDEIFTICVLLFLCVFLNK
jgi:hypothetical protein